MKHTKNLVSETREEIIRFINSFDFVFCDIDGKYSAILATVVRLL